MGQFSNISALEMLQNLSERRLSQVELNHFIEYCCRISFGYVKKKRSRLKPLIQNGRVDIEDLSVNAIVPLFCNDERNELLNLKNLYRTWDPAITTELQALFMLHRVIELRVNQQIAAALKEADPLFTKVLHSVNYHIRKCGLQKIRHNGAVYIVRNVSLYCSAPYIKYDDFQFAPAGQFNDEEQPFEKLFSYLEENGFYPAIPLNMLVKRIKSLYQESCDEEASINFCHNIDVEYLVNHGFEAAAGRLDSYIRKGKLTISEAAKFRKALQMAAFDLKNGGLSCPLQGYLMFYMAGLTEEEYRTRFQLQFEYFIKIMKNTIADMILKRQNVALPAEKEEKPAAVHVHYPYSAGYSIYAAGM